MVMFSQQQLQMRNLFCLLVCLVHFWLDYYTDLSFSFTEFYEGESLNAYEDMQLF